MPKPINETIGRCDCPSCANDADVRRVKNHPRGRLYLVCNDCGTIRPTGRKFQAYIVSNASLNDGHVFTEDELKMVEGPGVVPVTEPEPVEPGPVTVPVPKPEQGRKGPGFFGRVWRFYKSCDDELENYLNER